MDHETSTSATYTIDQLTSHFRSYAEKRREFLKILGQKASCRDPIAEFSEVLVSKLLNASFANSRVQKGYDLIRPNDRKVQVKYLSNPPGKWINGHEVDFASDVDDYALVVFVDLKLISVIVFTIENIEQVCKFLGKRHPQQDKKLQFTERNHERIIKEQSHFEAIGVEVFRFDSY